MRAWIMERVLRRVYWSNWRAEREKKDEKNGNAGDTTSEGKNEGMEGKRERQRERVRGAEREGGKDRHDASVGRHANLGDP